MPRLNIFYCIFSAIFFFNFSLEAQNAEQAEKSTKTLEAFSKLIPEINSNFKALNSSAKIILRKEIFVQVRTTQKLWYTDHKAPYLPGFLKRELTDHTKISLEKLLYQDARNNSVHTIDTGYDAYGKLIIKLSAIRQLQEGIPYLFMAGGSGQTLNEYGKGTPDHYTDFFKAKPIKSDVGDTSWMPFQELNEILSFMPSTGGDLDVDALHKLALDEGNSISVEKNITCLTFVASDVLTSVYFDSDVGGMPVKVEGRTKDGESYVVREIKYDKFRIDKKYIYYPHKISLSKIYNRKSEQLPMWRKDVEYKIDFEAKPDIKSDAALINRNDCDSFRDKAILDK